MAFVAYQTLVIPRLPRLAFYVQRIARDTKTWSWRANFIDFVMENRGVELRNVRISSDPDEIGWDRLDNSHTGKPTSEWFREIIPYVGENERRQFTWCELQSNTEVFKKPFTITVEFDNTVLPWPRRLTRTFKFNEATLKGTGGGLTSRYDIHNVAQEVTRIREQLEVMNRIIPDAIEEAFNRGEEAVDKDNSGVQ